MFIARTDVEAEIPILWPPDVILLIEALFLENKSLEREARSGLGGEIFSL